MMLRLAIPHVLIHLMPRRCHMPHVITMRRYSDKIACGLHVCWNVAPIDAPASQQGGIVRWLRRVTLCWQSRLIRGLPMKAVWSDRATIETHVDRPHVEALWCHCDHVELLLWLRGHWLSICLLELHDCLAVKRAKK